jgi:Fe-S-cluster formation regulator IscX/YfhJ
MAENGTELRLAVLIDADNASRTAMGDVMAEIAVYGTPTVKRIYGDWTTPNMASWKPILLEHAITPIQQYSYTTGKNSTDSAMIIDAMDILYDRRVDGFVLVSSDSDFTRLATRLREAGMKVFGMGERKTPAPFIVACDKFVYIEVIKAAGEKARRDQSAQEPSGKQEPAAKPAGKKGGKKKGEEQAPAAEPPAPDLEEGRGVPLSVVELIADSLEVIADEEGYAFMGELGNLLMKKQPDFDPRNFGFSKLTQLIKSLDRFEIDVRQTSNPHTKHIYLRDRLKK